MPRVWPPTGRRKGHILGINLLDVEKPGFSRGPVENRTPVHFPEQAEQSRVESRALVHFSDQAGVAPR